MNDPHSAGRKKKVKTDRATALRSLFVSKVATKLEAYRNKVGVAIPLQFVNPRQSCMGKYRKQCRSFLRCRPLSHMSSEEIASKITMVPLPRRARFPDSRASQPARAALLFMNYSNFVPVGGSWMDADDRRGQRAPSRAFDVSQLFFIRLRNPLQILISLAYLCTL